MEDQGSEWTTLHGQGSNATAGPKLGCSAVVFASPSSQTNAGRRSARASSPPGPCPSDEWYHSSISIALSESQSSSHRRLPRRG